MVEAEKDPFDLANLRLDQSFTQTVGVKKLLTTVPVKKPSPQDWVRVHSDPAYRMDSPIIELKDDGSGEEYIVAQPLVPELIGELRCKTLFTTINRQGVLSLWPVPLPDQDGKVMEWHRSAREGAEMAMDAWTRVRANRSLGAYEISQSTGCIAEPVWPELSFQQIIKIAFRDRLIDSFDHVVIMRLRGLV